MWSALFLTLVAAFAFTRGWLGAAVAILVVSTPLDLVARRLAILRLRPLPPKSLSARLLWPAAGLAMLALGWYLARHGNGWGASPQPSRAARSPKRPGSSMGRAKSPGSCGYFPAATRS